MSSPFPTSTVYHPPRRGIVATSDTNTSSNIAPPSSLAPQDRTPTSPTDKTTTSNLLTLIRHASHSLGVLSRYHKLINQASIRFSTLDGETTEFIGRGKTFYVSRIPLPEVVGLENSWPKRLVLRDPVKVAGPRGYAKEAVTCKRPLVELDPLGNPKHGADEEALEAVILEIQVLTHPPLFLHRNIVDFLGVSWKCDSQWFEPGVEKIGSPRRMPTILMEYARHGSFEDFRKTEDYQRLRFKDRAKLCRDIAEGLNILHKCGVVHGDVKLGNILIFDDNSGGVVAKLGDFGFSVGRKKAERGEDGADRWRLRGRTWPWNDPEWNQPRDWEQLMKTDVFSYGLLVWAILSEEELETLFGLNLGVASRNDQETRDKVEGMKDGTLSLKAAKHFKRNSEKVKLLVKSLFDCALDPRVENRGLMENIVEIWNNWFTDSPVYPAYPPDTPPVTAYPIVNIDDVQFETIATFMADAPPSVKKQFTTLHLNPSISVAERCISTLFCGLSHLIGWGVPKDLETGKRFVDGATKISLNAAVFQPMFFNSEQRDYTSAYELGVFTSLVAVIHDVAGYEAMRQLMRYLPMPFDVHYRRMRSQLLRKQIYRIDTDDYPASYKDEESAELQAEQREDIQKNLKNPRIVALKHNMLHYAVLSGFVEVVQEMLAAQDFDKALLEQKDLRGDTPLMIAFRLGAFKIAKLLIQAGADVQTRNMYKESLLHFLEEFDNLEELSEIADLIITLGAKNLINEWCTDRSHENEFITGTPKSCGHPLTAAIIRNNIPLVKILLKHGADPLQGAEDSPLMHAAMGHFADILELFWEACPTSPKWKGSSVLAAAIQGATGFQLMYFHGVHRTKQMLKRTFDFLLDKMESTLMFGKVSVLSFVIDCGSVDMVEYVLERVGGKEINSYGPNGFTPLHKAMCSTSVEKLKLLVEHGGDLTLPPKCGNQFPSLRLACTEWGGDPEIIRYLLDHGLGQACYGNWERAIIQAVGVCNFEVGQLLINAGADIDTLDEKGWTTIGLIVRTCTYNSVDQLRFLLEHQTALGKKPAGFMAIPEVGLTVLHLAAFIPSTSAFYDHKSMADVIDYLLDKFHTPEQLNAQDNDGMTALHHAAKEGNPVLVQRLLDFEATDRKIVCNSGVTAHEYALSRLVMGAPAELIELGGKVAEERWNKGALEVANLLGKGTEEGVTWATVKLDKPKNNTLETVVKVGPGEEKPGGGMNDYAGVKAGA